MSFYYHGGSGDTYTDKLIHADRDCSALGVPSMPIPDDIVEYSPRDLDRCPECDPDATDATTDTCEVVKNDGEVCGRSLPCQYHS